MKTTEQGLAAEQAVADLLEQAGFEIIDRNWKTMVCEIDIVAEKDEVVYLVEVKYRSSSAQGDGFEYIADQKLRRMNFAAEVWRQHHSWSGDYRLLAAAVSGRQCENIKLAEL
ncbi:MAG TPA: YraN family protein [Candidatus Saccharimonadales bacterium]|nr:YraN family protein [Candidatus Saccharimonadales bacterium]